MTSSLVGSEMCIRDSTIEPEIRRAAPGLAAVRAQALRVACLCQVGPVSYTHLTLPTICSV
eukprot:10381931-Prorocentrum_lima.AAC.1